MVMSNPRDSGLWTPRTQEFTGGYNPREVLDLDINPNEDSDGLSHHTLQTPEDMESVDQRDPKKRRAKALRELEIAIPHISVKPEKIDETLSRTPMTERDDQLLESALGVDMGQMANGGSLATGANVGPIRSPTGQISYQSDIGKSFSDILKAKRRYKGRRYSDDEEGEREEKKSKARNKRKKKRRGKSNRGFKDSSREPKSKTKRRAESAARNVGRGSKEQAFHPNPHSLAIRGVGATRSESLPLRLRDPVAYQRKLAYEKNRRMMGALPRGLSQHFDTRGITGRGTVIGAKGRGTSLPKVPKLGTRMSSGASQDRLMAGAVGDPLGTHDPLAKSATKLTRAEISRLKAMLRKLTEKIDKLTKATPELEENAKRGAPAGGTSDPTGPTELNDEERAQYRFGDTSINTVVGITGKR